MDRHPNRFPRGPEDLTPDWLTYALRSSGALPIGHVVAVHAELLEHQGQASRVYGLTVEYTGYPSPPPTKLVAKLPPLSSYQSAQELLQAFVTEATFYQSNTRSALPIPVCYFADVEAQGQTGFVLLLEDLRPLKPLIFVDTAPQLVAGMDAAMNSVALLHGHFWRGEVAPSTKDPERLYLPGSKAFVAYSKPTMQMLAARYGERLPKSLMDYCAALQRESPALSRGFALAPTTFVHYDVHPAQVMAGRPNRPAMLIDWALGRWGTPTADAGVNLGPWGAPYELRWARLYHAELNQQLGRDRAWSWDDFYLRFRVSPPHVSILMYVAAFMEPARLQRIVDEFPDTSWFARPTVMENFLEWPAQWIERHGAIDAVAEIEALGQASLQADSRVISTGPAPSPVSPAAGAAAADRQPLSLSFPPPAMSLSSVPPPRASSPPLVLLPQQARGPAKRFPTTGEDLTPRWLTDALRSSGAMHEGEVVRVEAELVEHQGQASLVYGLKLEYSGCDAPPPSRLIAKIPPEVAYQPVTDLQKNAICEVTFYRRYGRDPLLPIATCYYADVDATSGNVAFAMLLEDLHPLIPLELVQSEQELDDGVMATMRAAAALHARFWRRDALAGEKWLNGSLYRGDPRTAKWYRNVVERVRAKHGAKLTSTLQRFCDFVQMESEALFNGFAMFPHSLIHFDVHPRQVMFGASRARLIDWSAATYGVPVLDVCFDGGPWSAQLEARWHRAYYEALSEHLARDNQSWAQDDFELCLRAHPPRLDVLLYVLAYMDSERLERFNERALEREWLPRPTWQQYCFEWTTDWMERHRTLEAFEEIIERGATLSRK